MRVMTWNVWWRFGGAWQEREPIIAATLAAAEPDIVGLVETWAGEGTTAGGGDPRAVTLSSELREAPLEATKQIDRRIDHILARPGRPGGTVRVNRVFLAGDRPVDGRYPSDHFAVVADVEP